MVHLHGCASACGHPSLQGLTACWAASALVLARAGWPWLLGFGNIITPLCPAALEGHWLPALADFWVAVVSLFDILPFSSPLRPMLCVKFPVIGILVWFHFSHWILTITVFLLRAAEGSVLESLGQPVSLLILTGILCLDHSVSASQPLVAHIKAREAP